MRKPMKMYNINGLNVSLKFANTTMNHNIIKVKFNNNDKIGLLSVI